MSFDAFSSDYPNALPAGTRIRDYSIVSVIGIGGFSIVYKAMDNALMREVAIKEYFPGGIALRDNEGKVHPQTREIDAFHKGIESFLKEGKLLAQFDHPALVRVYRFWEERGTAYLAMRLYNGVTLRDAVKAGTWSANEHTLPALLLPICDALDVLHSAHCYHRDVAPDNILLSENNWPVLLDFGAARKAIEGTQVFTAILKPGYAPIEQYGDGELKQGPWTDIYALAGVVHFALSGNPPPTAISRMLRDSMPRPRDVFAGRLPAHWLDGIENSLAVKPEARPQSMAEFISLLGWDAMSAPVVDIATQAVRVERLPPQLALDTVIVAPPIRQAALAVNPSAETRIIDSGLTTVAPRGVHTAAAPRPPQPPPELTDAATEPNKTGLWIAMAATLIAAAIVAGGSLSGGRDAPESLSTKTQNPMEIAPKNTPPSATAASDPTAVLPSHDTSVSPNASLPKEASPAEAPSMPTKVSPVPKTEAVQPASVSEPEPAPVLERKVETRRTTHTPRADRGQAEPRVPTESRRPARCSGLMDRWQLGAVLGDEEQRFLTETCK